MSSWRLSSCHSQTLAVGALPPCRQRPGGHPAACPVRAPFGAVRGASAVCAAMSAPSRPSGLPPPCRAAGSCGPSGASARAPARLGRCAPLRRVGSRPGSVGLGLSARGRARRSGPPSPPPPRLGRPSLFWPGGRARCASPRRVLRLALCPLGLPAVGLALRRARLGLLPLSALAGPPLPARPYGAAAPSLLRAGGRAPPCGRLPGRFAAPGAIWRAPYAGAPALQASDPREDLPWHKPWSRWQRHDSNSAGRDPDSRISS